jgi:hypothetical protein
MIRVILTIIFFYSSPVFAGLPAYDISAGGGAAFNPVAGIVPAGSPVTLGVTAANDAVVASRSIPVAANTPYGPVAGTVKTAGLLSKPAIGALMKGLLRAVPLISVGSAIYDAMQAANMSIDSAGNAMVSGPDCTAYFSGFVDSWTTTYVKSTSGNICVVDYYYTSNFACNYLGGCIASQSPYSHAQQAGAPGQPSPASGAQKDAAIDAYVGANNGNALRGAQEALAGGQSLPSVAVDPALSPAAAPMVSPWTTTGTSIDPATGAVTSTQKQAQVEVLPPPDLASPIPVKVTENTRTIVNNNITNNSSSVVNNSQTGFTPSPVVQSSTPAPAPAPDPCIANPDRMGCITEGAMPQPEVIKEKTLDFASFAFNTFTFSGTGACPADRTISKAGVTFHYAPVCNFMSFFHYGALAFAFFIGGMIMVGQRQSATD